MGLRFTFWKCLAVLYWLVTDLWFGKAITVRGLSFQYCRVHFAKQLHLSVAWRAQPAFSGALKAVKSPVSKENIEEPHKHSDFCFDYHDFTLQGLKGNSSCASSNSWYLHVCLTYLARKLAESLVQLCRNYSGLLCGRFLPGIRFNALTLLECQYNREPATAPERNVVQVFLLLLRSSVSSVAAQKMFLINK